MLDGRGGNDTLIGLGGADVFAFTSALGTNNVDTVRDFAAGDLIGLASYVFAGVTDGGITAGELAAGAAAQDADDRIIYNQATGRLLYDADGSGAGATVLFARFFRPGRCSPPPSSSWSIRSPACPRCDIVIGTHTRVIADDGSLDYFRCRVGCWYHNRTVLTQTARRRTSAVTECQKAVSGLRL